MSRLLVCACLIGLGATQRVSMARAQGPRVVLRAKLVDARTTEPLAEALVILTRGPDTLARSRTDARGRFEATLADSQPAMLHFVRVGYRPDSVTVAASALPLRLALAPLRATVATLSPLIVRDSAVTAFERRARRNAGGIFIRERDIEARKPLRTSDVLRGRAGILVGADSAGIMQIIATRDLRYSVPRRLGVTSDSTPIPAPDSKPCPLRIGVNGRLMPNGYSMDDVQPRDIAAIEAYIGAATVPIEFSSVRTDAPCGIVMLWLKGGSEGKP